MELQGIVADLRGKHLVEACVVTLTPAGIAQYEQTGAWRNQSAHPGESVLGYPINSLIRIERGAG